MKANAKGTATHFVEVVKCKMPFLEYNYMPYFYPSIDKLKAGLNDTLKFSNIKTNSVWYITPKKQTNETR